MKSIGAHLKAARLSKKKTYQDLEKDTKIKIVFIKALENESWSKLPDFPVVTGFVKRIADSLEISQHQALAFLRRDYPPQKVRIAPKQDVFSTFKWSPRLTFIIGIFLATVAVLSYLGFQYVSFTRPPDLDLASPTEGQVIEDNMLTVVGTTDSDATIKINNQPALVDDQGTFETTIEIFEGTKEIVVTAVARSGKETTIRRTISPQLEN